MLNSLALAARLDACPGLQCAKPDGAFYVFPSCRGTFGKRTPSGATIREDTDFALELLGAEGVAIVQGSAFGCPGHFRVSYAASMAKLQEACVRIERFCGSLLA